MVLAAGALALILGCRASTTPATCVPMAVHPVHIVGTGAMTESELRTPFQSLERMELPWPTLVTTAFADALAAAVADLRALLDDRGYLYAVVRDTKYTPSTDRRWIDVTITVDEGKRFKVGAISLRDTDGAPAVDSAATLAAFPAKTGDWYSQHTVDVGMSAIVGAYADKGIGARATAVDTFDGGEAMDVVIEIRRRAAIDRVGTIEVFGVATEKRELAIAGMLGLRVGDRVDPARLHDAKLRLMASGEFAAVEVRAFDGERPGDREVEVVVSERVPVPP